MENTLDQQVPTSATVGHDRREKVKRYFAKNGPLFLLMLPGLIHIFMIKYMPMFGMVIAFKKYRFSDGIFGSQWVGFENFRFLFGSKIAWQITWNTVLMNTLFIVTGTVAALLLGILLNEIYTSRMSRVYQTALFLPFFVGAVIMGYFAYAILKSDGFINTLIIASGGEKISFYLEPKYWRFILTVANLWSGLGFGTVLYLAGIIGINPEFYEAAEIDGASKLQQIFHITLPLIRYLVVIQVLLAIGKIFFANFGLFYFVPQLYKNGALMPVVDVIDTFVFRAFQGGYGIAGGQTIVNLGMAAAAGVYQSVVGFVLVVSANLIVRKMSPEQALF